MFSTGHFFSGIVLYKVLEMLFPVTSLQGVAIVFASVFIPDLDYLIYRREHRFSPLHTIYVPLALALLGFANIIFAYMALATTMHLLLDTVDAGIMWLYPFNRKLYGLFLSGTEPKPFLQYLREYVHSKPMMFLEVLFFVGSIVFLLFV